MGFDLGAAMQGAGSGAALGPWGAIGGGLIGGFMGGGSPDLYDAEQYHRDMAPYLEMLEKQQLQSESMLDRGSALNREQEQMVMANSMDQMGVANTMASRNNAQAGGGMGNSGLLASAVAQNQAQYANQGLGAANDQFMQMYGQGMNLQQNVTQGMGNYYGNLANLNAANVGTMNQYDQQQSSQMMSGMGGLMGAMDGAGGFGDWWKNNA